MENCGEVDVMTFMGLMKDYLERRIDVNQYRTTYFGLSKKRVNIPDEQANRIIQQAYGDADDYDPIVRLPYTIDERELRERVIKSLEALVALGYSVAS